MQGSGQGQDQGQVFLNKMKLFWVNDVADRVLYLSCRAEHAIKRKFLHFPTAALKDVEGKKKSHGF